MINKIHTYGCSFSYPFWIDEEKTYTHLVSKEYNCDYTNRSFPALCNDEIFNNLTNDLNQFVKNDLIIYQFTSIYREGFHINEETYFSTAGISRDHGENKVMLDKWSGGRDKFQVTDNQIDTLLDYTDSWSIHSIKHRFYRVYNLLEYLKNNVGIKYRFLFLDNFFNRFPEMETSIKFPIKNNYNNVSILDWVVENKLTLSDTNTGVHPNDKHPNEFGHQEIANKIISSIKPTKLI